MCMFVCFLSFSVPSHLFLSLSITERNSCVEYDYERHRCGAHAFISYPFSGWFSFFLLFHHHHHLLLLLLRLVVSFFSLLLPSYHTLTHNVHWWRSERISFALEIAWMIFFSLSLSFVSPPFLLKYTMARKRKTHPIRTITKSDDLWQVSSTHTHTPINRLKVIGRQTETSAGSDGDCVNKQWRIDPRALVKTRRIQAKEIKTEQMRARGHHPAPRNDNIKRESQ